MAKSDVIDWVAPGPGLWAYDPAHFPAPATGFLQRTNTPGASEGFAAGYARYGHPNVTTERSAVNGWTFGRRVPIDGSLFDERERAAIRAYDLRLWREDSTRWYATEGPAIFAECAAFQSIDPADLDDHALADHLQDALELLRRTQYHHFSHIPMTFVVGEWLLAARSWGIAEPTSYALLAGASPATAAAADHLSRIAEELLAAGKTEPESLEDTRNASEGARVALDTYLEGYGWRLVGGFDVDASALIEMPDVVLSSIRTALLAKPANVRIDPRTVRDQVPAEERHRFDDLLAEARLVYGIRDDDVGPCMWARGLIRRTLLEIAVRLTPRRSLRDTANVFDAGADELVALLGGSAERSGAVAEPMGPSAEELAARTDLRRRQAQLQPPSVLGDPPSFDGELPPTVARVARSFAAYIGNRPPSPAGIGRVTGTGIGDTPYVGHARVALRAEDAFGRLEPGDVLITVTTTPAFNSVLPIAGALVVEFGGLTSHAGIMARELGIAAVVDARGCTTLIPDGAEVEVDPVEGVVRLL